jgi:hypothetical protein
MNAVILPLLGAGAMAAISPALGWPAHFVLLALLLSMQGVGLLICRALGQATEPFSALIVGFIVVAHALFAADFLIPGVQPTVAAAFIVPAALGFVLTWEKGCGVGQTATVGLALLACLYAFCWSADIGPRMRQFQATGEFAFWVDGLTHAGSLAQFSAPAAVGRGMMLMADTPRPLYHFASYSPAALLPPLAGVSPIDATMLAWLPLGILLMACGVAALGLVLQGPWLAAAALMALAAAPDLGRFGWGNGFLVFDWLLEAAPGTAYSLAVACAALAALARWARDQGLNTLALAAFLTAGCALVRFNTFLWLAPTLVLAGVASWRRLTTRLRLALVALGLLGLVALLIALSWEALRTNPIVFLFSYIESLPDHVPVDFQAFLSSLPLRIGHVAAAFVGLGFALLETAGWWLALYAILGVALWRRGRLEAMDWTPAILLAVASLSMILAPVARNGDPTEFRHRAGPLLVVVLATWSLRFAAVAAAEPMSRISLSARRIALTATAIVSLAALYVKIGEAKRPRMAWAQDYYDQRVPPELMKLAPMLNLRPDLKPRFAMAHQPRDSRAMDDAARLVALSGVPAYISCPAFLLVTGGNVGEEAKRRMAALERLDQAPSLEALQAAMRAEGATYYIANSAGDAPFDPKRLQAIGHEGQYAIYAVPPTSRQIP